MHKKQKQKQKAAKKALRYVKNNTILGLGSGSTMAIFVELLSEKNLNVKVIPTSKQIEKVAIKNKLKIIKKSNKIDLAVDGFDQVIGKTMLKGHGALAFVKEKEIDYKAKKSVFIADSSKLSKTKKFTLPIMVAIKPNKKKKTIDKLKKFGKLLILSKRDDSKNIVGKLYMKIKNPKKLEKQLDKIASNGLFANFKTKPKIIIGK